MKKKIIVPITIVIIFLGVVAIVSIIPWLFNAQYNSHGVSHFLVITIDPNEPKQYIGKLENHEVYIEKMALAETNFRTINAENLSIKEAIEKDLVSIEDWREYAWKIKRGENSETLIYENYEIEINSTECIIRPITK